MQHQNYVIECDRRYAEAFRDGMVDESTRRLYQRFLTVKRELEHNTERRDAEERLWHTGRHKSRAEADSARRACNGNESELGFLTRSISLAILKMRRQAA